MDIRKFFIKPVIPERIKSLNEIAFNVWSCWDMDAQRLFHRIEPQLFRKLSHSPVELLYRLDPALLEEAAKDEGFLYELDRVYDKFKRYMKFEGSYVQSGKSKPFSTDDVVAYICMEYGLHESIPAYSGGLAVLAGDQLKAVSDIGLEMVGFGLLYRTGYFNQHISPEGKQIEEYREINWYLSPLLEVHDDKGLPLLIEVPIKSSKVFAKVWKLQVGRVPLYLFDTDIHQNDAKFRKITRTLYDADRHTRLEQELILGRGSVIAMDVLGIKPKLYHLNEGHTAFSILERMLRLVRGKHRSVEEAKDLVRYSTIFTTHTPVIAGNENFDDELIDEYLEKDVELLGMTINEFLNLGKVKKEKNFWLPAYALRHSGMSNGVSKIHAEVSRKMWRNLFPTLHEDELPITAITNGVHIQTWLSLQMTELFNRYVGPDYTHKAESPGLWKKIAAIPDGEIWNAHRRRKEQTVSFIRRRVGDMMKKRGYGKNKIKDLEMVLNPDYLTIGFARRFVQYKRANLILSDPERLVSILTNEDRPVQLVFAGKAHPADTEGKNIIKSIIDFINEYPVENHVVFMEDYDINVARHLVQGVDVWLNTPQKPLEASGTSGIKAAINGVLNLSVLDGWWPEAYDGENGWAITGGDFGDSSQITNEAEALHLYELLEREVAELFYNRTESDIPVGWVKMMKNSIAGVAQRFNMHHTMREYLYKMYLPQMQMSERLVKDDSKLLKAMCMNKGSLDAVWSKVYIKDYFTSINGKMPLSGDTVNIDCYVYIDDVDEKLFNAEVFYCAGDGAATCKSIPLKYVERYPDKVAKYSGGITLEGTGQQQIGVRLVPSNPDFRQVYPEYVKWKE